MMPEIAAELMKVTIKGRRITFLCSWSCQKPPVPRHFTLSDFSAVRCALSKLVVGRLTHDRSALEHDEESCLMKVSSTVRGLIITLV